MARSPKSEAGAAPGRVIWRASYDSKNFSFEAFGETKTGAREALKLGLKHHANQYNIASDWWGDDEFKLAEVHIGAAYRDGELIK